MPIYFDESLPLLADIIAGQLGEEALSSGVALRDATGTLAFFVDGDLAAEQLEKLSASLRSALGPYARPDRVLADRQAPGAARVLADPEARFMAVKGRSLRVLDRRIVGPDWLRSPESAEQYPPRIVFSSLKGGVGRSTALAVLAADQARRNRNVLVMDLDLEAPGVGTMLLADDRRPRLGAIDVLVENGLREISDEEINDLVGTSGLTTGAGVVEVVPVVGTLGRDHPQSFLAKLSRALIEDLRPDGTTASLRDQLRELVDRVTARRAYDLVLIDARAGLSELTAGPILGLGATVLIFGTAQPQTIESLRYLLSHLASLTRAEEPAAWRERIKMVHAKASLAEEAHQQFNDQLWDLFSDFIYEEVAGLTGFNFDVHDPAAPHWPLPITFDPRFVDWDPVKKPTELTHDFYQATFGSFLKTLDELGLTA